MDRVTRANDLGAKAGFSGAGITMVISGSVVTGLWWGIALAALMWIVGYIDGGH